jgi:hypothetical protein
MAFLLSSLLLLLLNQHASGFQFCGAPVLPSSSSALRRRPLTRRLGEPIPIGTVDGGRPPAPPVTLVPKNIDRTQRFFPGDLDGDGDGPPVDRLREVAELKARAATQASEAASVGLTFGGFDLAAAVLWSVTLWYGVLNDVFFARAERPSDLVLPAIGRLLGFRADKDQWLEDFENGSRGRFPLVVRAVALPIFFLGGVFVEQWLKVVYTGAPGGGGDEGAVFATQLGVIGCIWAGVYEIGRIETGDSLNSREEDDEKERVWQEMVAFSEANLERCEDYAGSINAIEVVRKFRRSHTRHRRTDQEGSASDALLVDLFRTWHQRGYARVSDGYDSFGVQRTRSTAPKPTSSGFYKGLKFRDAPLSVVAAGASSSSSSSSSSTPVKEAARENFQRGSE